MKHTQFQTIRTYIRCGKCNYKWYVQGLFVKYICPKCKHEDSSMKSL